MFNTRSPAAIELPSAFTVLICRTPEVIVVTPLKPAASVVRIRVPPPLFIKPLFPLSAELIVAVTEGFIVAVGLAPPTIRVLPERLYPFALKFRLWTLIGRASVTVPEVPPNTALSNVGLFQAWNVVPLTQIGEVIFQVPVPPVPVVAPLVSHVRFYCA